MMTKYRSVVLLFALLLVGLTACGGEKTKKEVDHPTVRLQAGENTYEEKVYSYCWPETAANVVCKTNYDVREQPSKIITVASGDSLHLLIDEKYGTPQQVTTTVLNGPGGQQALGATTDGIYLVALENGAYQLQVDVTYTGIEGRQTYVSYIFGLDVQGGSLAALPSPTPVIVVATAEPTEEVTATTEPTKEAIVTSEPTEEVVAESTEESVATTEPTEEVVVVEPTETPVQRKTAEPTLQTVIKASPTKAAVVPPSSTPFAVAVQPTATRSIPTATPTAVPPTATQPVPTATQPVPTATEALALEVPPTATLPAVLPSATLIAAPPTVPNMTLNFGGRTYMPLGYQYCQREASGQRICVELPADNIDPSRITLLRGAAVQLQIDGTRPNEVRIEYLSDTGIATGQPETKRGDNIILFSVMPEPGTYIMTIRVTWQNEDATYYFRVAVSD